MSFEQELIARYLPARLATSRSVSPAGTEPDHTAVLCAATAAIVRVDERLRAASPAVRAGWLVRAHLHEASASARLDEAFADPHDLLLMDHHALDRLVDQNTQRAYQVLQMLRAAARRHPRQLFTPRRLIAAARLRLRDRSGTRAFPEWLEQRRADPSEVFPVLQKALDPAMLAGLRGQPALKGALEFLTVWHTSGAADVIGGSPGRALATAWLRRIGLITEASFLPALGFLGYASEYRPGDRPAWPRLFLEAAVRAADWQLALLQRLCHAEQRFLSGVRPGRTSSHLPALAALVLASAAVSARGAAATLGISGAAARRLLSHLERQAMIREITGREAFRLFAEA